MKRNVLLLTNLVFVFSLFAQTIVGTDPENKNVILEEFTGIHCGYCPDGHAIAQGILDQHPDDVVLINIHVGPFAQPGSGEPDYRTVWGEAIKNQADVAGYPAGTVNRHLFPGWGQDGGTAMSRGNWTAAANQILAAPSYLNVGIESFITAAGQLTVNVEVYYTGDSPESTNLLNVGITQNNIYGPQSGGGAGNNYQHMHMLRHLITGQWGVEITETTEGSLYSNTFTYDVPEHYNDVPVVLEDIEIFAFVSETHQEIISGVVEEPIMEAAYDYDATVSDVLYPLTEACTGELTPRIELKNYGAVTLTSLDIEYSVNDGDVYTYDWTGELEYTATEELTLPAVPFVMEPTNNLNIVVSNPNGVDDENPTNNESNTAFDEATNTSMNVEMQLFVGAMGNQISWDFYNGDGELLAEGSGYNNNEIVSMELPVDGGGCYTFYLYDSGGDGFAGGGYLKLYDDGLVFTYITDELSDVVGVTFEAMNPLTSPDEFVASIDDYVINFEWTAPAKAVLEGYNIYEASDMDTPINDALITETNYTYTVSENGYYEYYLAAVYDEGMSDLVGPVFADINVGIEELQNGTFNVYPNPIVQNAQIALTLKENAQVEWSLISLTGSTVVETSPVSLSAGQQTIEINTDHIEDGLYFINLKINGKAIIKKITVLK